MAPQFQTALMTSSTRSPLTSPTVGVQISARQYGKWECIRRPEQYFEELIDEKMPRSTNQIDYLQTGTINEATGEKTSNEIHLQQANEGPISATKSKGKESEKLLQQQQVSPENDATVSSSTTQLKTDNGTTEQNKKQSLNIEAKNANNRQTDGNSKVVLPDSQANIKTLKYVIVSKHQHTTYNFSEKCPIGALSSRINEGGRPLSRDPDQKNFAKVIQTDGNMVNFKIQTINENGTGPPSNELEDVTRVTIPNPQDAFLTIPQPQVPPGLSSPCRQTHGTLVGKDEHGEVQGPGKPRLKTRLPGTNLIYRTPGANNINKNGKVKRPMNAFMVWARTYRAKLADEFPNTTNSDVSVRLGQVWNEMTDDQKRPYYQEAERIKQMHKLQYPDWSYTPTPARRRCDDLASVNNIAHNVYWSRYNTGPVGSFTGASFSEAIKSEGGEAFMRCQVTPRLLMPQPNNAPVAELPAQAPAPAPVSAARPAQPKPVPLTPQSPLGIVYRPVPLKPPIQIPHIDSSGPTSSGSAKSAKPKAMKTDNQTKKKNHSPDCPAFSEQPGNNEAAPCNNCTCKTTNGNKKRGPRKPRSQRKEDGKGKRGADGSSHSMFNGLQNDLGCQQFPDRLLNMLPLSEDCVNLSFEDDYPLDPYNPFYLMDLEGNHCRDPEPDDLDVDRWKLYLEDRTTSTDIKQEAEYVNLDVFLSDAQVSRSATSNASSDIEIIPTPLATTLGRLKPPENPMTRWEDALEEPRGSRRHFAQLSQISTRNGTPRPKDLAKRSEPLVTFDLPVVNEVVVETTTHSEQQADSAEIGHESDVLEQSDHVSHVLVLTKDRRGGGDSVRGEKPRFVKELYFGKHADFSERPRCTGGQDGIQTVSPPGKRPCV